MFFRLNAWRKSSSLDISIETIGLTWSMWILLQFISGPIWYSIYRLQRSISIPINSLVHNDFTLPLRALYIRYLMLWINLKFVFVWRLIFFEFFFLVSLKVFTTIRFLFFVIIHLPFFPLSVIHCLHSFLGFWIYLLKEKMFFIYSISHFLHFLYSSSLINKENTFNPKPLPLMSVSE